MPRPDTTALALLLAPLTIAVPSLATTQDPAHSDDVIEATPDAAPIQLAFGWPETGSVGLEVDVARASGSGRYTCRLSWAPDEAFEPEHDGQQPHRIVRYSDFEFLELNGKQPDDPEFRALTRELAPTLAAVPPFRVDANGEFLGLLDEEAAARGMAEALGSLGVAAHGMIGRMLSDPMTRGMIENSIAEDWSWWASFWNEYETTPGEAVTSRVDFPSGLTGNPIHADMTCECVDLHERDGERAVHMRASTVYDEADMLRVTMATLRKMSDGPVPEDAIRSVARTDEVDGIYTIDGLRPLEVHWKKTITVDGGSGAKESVERKTWTFDWSQ